MFWGCPMAEYCEKEGEISKISTEIKAMWKRIDEMRQIYGSLAELTKSVQSLTVSTSLLAEQMSNTRQDVAEVKADMEEIKKRPGDSWNNLTRVVTSSIVTGLIGLLIGRLLM